MYGVSFFNASLEQMYDNERENIQAMAIATRGAKTEDFEKFLKQFDKKVEKLKEDDHQNNISMLSRKL